MEGGNNEATWPLQARASRVTDEHWETAVGGACRVTYDTQIFGKRPLGQLSLKIRVRCDTRATTRHVYSSDIHAKPESEVFCGKQEEKGPHHSNHHRHITTTSTSRLTEIIEHQSDYSQHDRS
jgi:hypothetical protein